MLIAAVTYNHVKNKDEYSKYVIETQKDNTEREEHGLGPNNIMSYKVWKSDKGQITKTNVVENVSMNTVTNR